MLEKRKKKIIVILSVFAGCTAGLFLIVYLSGLNRFLEEDLVIPQKLQFIGFFLTAAAIAFIITARIKKLENAVRGYFFFSFIGIAAFVICVGMRIAGKDITGSFLLYLFNIWTFFLRPAAYLIAPLIGVSEFLRKGLLLIILTYCSGQAYLGIQKQKRFEANLAEKKEIIKQSDSDPR